MYYSCRRYCSFPCAKDDVSKPSEWAGVAYTFKT